MCGYDWLNINIVVNHIRLVLLMVVVVIRNVCCWFSEASNNFDVWFMRVSEPAVSNQVFQLTSDTLSVTFLLAPIDDNFGFPVQLRIA